MRCSDRIARTVYSVCVSWYRRYVVDKRCLLCRAFLCQSESLVGPGEGNVDLIGRFYCLSEFDQANLSTTLLLFRYSDRVPTVYRSIHIL